MVFDGGIPDLAITKVSNNQNQYSVVITRKGSKPVPVDLTVNYTDGTTKLIHQSIKCWANGEKTYTVSFTAKGKINKLVLGGIYAPDSHKEDNVWEVK